MKNDRPEVFRTSPISNRRENITDWALAQFQEHYQDKKIDKWGIFYYVYGVLHHPAYREKFADNLKRELPRIPFAPAVSGNSEPRTLVSGGVAADSLANARGSEELRGSAFAEPEPRTSVSDGSGAGAADAESLADARGSGKQAEPHSDALAYFITFHTYGSWFHGAVKGSVDPKHNVPGTEFLPPDVERERAEFQRLKHEPVVFDAKMRGTVDAAIREVCKHRGWELMAINVRTNRVHVVVAARATPERVMNDFKVYGTRGLVQAGLFEKGAKVWSRHGSTPYLWNEKSVEDACRYVIEGQGAELPKESEPRTLVSDGGGGADASAESLTDVRGSGSTASGNAASGFWAFAEAGEKLAKLHLDYEKLKPWELEFQEMPDEPLSYRVDDKMRLSKDKTRLAVNKSLTLAGIPPETFEYRLGNRSALEWVIDQYQVSTDKRSGITSDPNRADDEEYIVRLVGQVVRVSVETVKIVRGLPGYV